MKSILINSGLGWGVYRLIYQPFCHHILFCYVRDLYKNTATALYETHARVHTYTPLDPCIIMWPRL